MQTKAKLFNELTTKELYEILKARADIFVVEQNCVYQDLDDIDYESLHVFYEEEGKVVEYKYREDEFGFTFIFERNPMFLSDEINDKKNDKITPKFTTLDHRIVEAVKANKYITIPELAALTGKSEPTIHRHLDVLVKSGRITRVGSRKTGFWDIQDQYKLIRREL